MAHIFTALSSAKLMEVSTRIEDDFIDRLHYQVAMKRTSHSFQITSMTLVVFSVGVCFKQFGGRPIECALSQIAEGSDEEVWPCE